MGYETRMFLVDASYVADFGYDFIHIREGKHKGSRHVYQTKDIKDPKKYFFSSDDIEWFCEEHEMETHELRLVICEPNKYRLVTSDYWDDIWPENLERLPKDIEDALETFNSVLINAKPLSWRPGKKRTSFKLY